MNRKHSKIVSIAAAIALVAFGATSTLHAEDPPKVKRTVVLKEDMSIPDREGVMVRVEIPPGVSEGKHTHPAEVFFFILEGAITQEIDGKPTVDLKAGDVVHIPPNTVHQATNKGSVPAKLAVVFVAEKGKPLTTPVK
jgi:quercetin dioxygenase-like cupin family protein